MCDINDISVDADVVGHIVDIEGVYYATDYGRPMIVGYYCSNCGEEFGQEDDNINESVKKHLAKVTA